MNLEVEGVEVSSNACVGCRAIKSSKSAAENRELFSSVVSYHLGDTYVVCDRERERVCVCVCG